MHLMLQATWARCCNLRDSVRQMVEIGNLVIVISGVVHLAMVICSADPAAACPNTEDSALVTLEDHSHSIVLVVEEWALIL